MSSDQLPSVSARVPAAFPPRWAFFKGLLTGAVIEVPALALGVWVLAHAGFADRTVSFMRILRFTAMFAGIAALLTAAGIGRLAAHASVDRIGGRRHAVWLAARAHAVASAGLLIIALLPHGHLPNPGLRWLWVPIAGLPIGAACGSVIGLVCGGAAPVRIADVMAIAIKRPTVALRHLLDPEDLIKLGVAVRDRTTAMLGGIFEPAQKPPKSDPDKPKRE